MKIKISRCTVAPANRIYLIDALGGSDLQTAIGKHETLVDEISAVMPEQLQFISEKIFLRKCSTLNEIKEIFKTIERECDAKTSPLIFVDGHGNKELGLALPSDEFLSWNDFNTALEKITLAAVGNSTVVASFCHSMAAVERPLFGKPLPTPFYFGYADEVQAGVIEDECQNIIKELLRTGSFDKSGKTIRHYSEYDHIEPQISVLLMKFLHHQKVSEVFPDLSKNNLRKMFHDEIGRDFGTTKDLHKVLAKAFDLRVLMESILTASMHATERRTKLLTELLNEIELDKERSTSAKNNL